MLGVRCRQVLLGIEAPKTVAVHREEIAEMIANETRAKAGEATPE